MSTCQDCKNFRSQDDLVGYCLAAEGKLVDAERDSEDCLAAAFSQKDENQEII